MMMLVEAFGAQAVFGNRQLYMDEMTAMLSARRVVEAYQSRAHAKNGIKWSQDNPGLQRIIDEAMIMRIEAANG